MELNKYTNQSVKNADTLVKKYKNKQMDKTH